AQLGGHGVRVLQRQVAHRSCQPVVGCDQVEQIGGLRHRLVRLHQHSALDVERFQGGERLVQAVVGLQRLGGGVQPLVTGAGTVPDVQVGIDHWRSPLLFTTYRWISDSTVSPSWLMTVTCSSTRPRCGRRGWSVIVVISARTVMLSPRNTGLMNRLRSYP